jgi:N-methylhydantoinase B/oxoprolinase/acetone carboxylase alpha subunit
VEAPERAHPVRVLRDRLRAGSGGSGLAAGGEEIERDLELLEDATVSLITELTPGGGAWGSLPVA